MIHEQSPNMFSKVGKLLGSTRFWGATLSAASAALAHPEHLADIISIWFGAITTIGTLDKITGHGTK